MPLIALGQNTSSGLKGNAKSQEPITKKIKRWFEFDTLSISSRYRLIRANNDRTTTDQLQYQFVGRGHFKFDQRGRFGLYFSINTGNSITSGWNTTGLGTGDFQSKLFVKQLYFDAKPVKEFEMQIGGIGVNNGENTEITGYDNDVYLTGERVILRSPKHLYFDEVSVTNAYLGDVTSPGVFRRLRHLDKSNYHQFALRKRLSKHVAFSADYTFESGIDTLRQAVKFNIPKANALDSVLFENYERLAPDHGYGFGVYGEKIIPKRLTLGGGFTRIDRPMLNGDRYPPRKRVYGNAIIKLTPELSLTGFVIRGVGNLPSPTSVRTRFDLILSYNILGLLHRKRLF